MNIEPIIRKDSPPIPPESPTETPETPRDYPESLKKIFRKHPDLYWETTGTGFHSGPVRRRKGYSLALWSVTASLVDALILIAMNCIFLIAFIKIIKTPVTQSVLHDFAILFVMGSWLYMITTRIFIGSSIGEAAFDIRLGHPRDRLSPLYFAKVVLRATIILATGILPLPLLGLIFGKDLVGTLSGLKLFSLK